MDRPERQRKKPARYKSEPLEGSGDTKSLRPSIVGSEPDTKSKAKLESNPKTERNCELAKTLSSGNNPTQLSFTQYEPQLVQHTGSYPEEKQVRLEESRRKTPIYLFRSSRPGLGSGIEVKDGNSVKMVPRACIDGSAAHDNVYLIPNLEAMVNSHLSGGTSIQSEFSSWAASSTVSAHFWALNNDPQARMSVIDTRKYTKTAIYHVPNLYDAGLSRKQYPHEHLLHGIVEVGSGSGYSSISWNEAISKDFDTLVPRPPCYWIPNHIKPLPQDQTISLLTKEEIEAAIRIASRFGPEFIIPLTASLLSHKPRSWRRPKSSFASQDVHAVAEALKQYPVADIEDYSKVTNVATDAVYALAYEEITQMNILLQLLAKHTLREKMEDRKKYEKKYDKNQAGKTSKKAKKSFRAGRTWTMCEF